MKSPKKYLFIPLIILASAVGSACSSGKSVTSGGNTAAPSDSAAVTTLPELAACDTTALDSVTSPIEMTFWHGMNTTLADELVKLTDSYNSSQTKVKIKLVAQGGYEQTIDAYLQGSESSRPDVVQMPEYMVQSMVDTKTMLPMQSCVNDAKFDLSTIGDKAVTAYSTQGALQAMPFNLSNPVLFYNKKIFKAAGLDPEVSPKSLEDLTAFSEKIIASGAAKYGISLDSALDSGGGWYLEQWFAKAGELYTDNENGRTARSTKVLFNSKTGTDLLTYLQGLLTSKLAVSVGDNASGQDQLLKLVDKKELTAMTIATTAALGPVMDVIKGGQFKEQISLEDLGIGPMPGPNGTQGALVGGASLWIVDKGDNVKNAAAWDYIKFMVSAQSQSTWAAKTGYFPVNKAAETLDPLKTTYATDSRFKVGFDQLMAAKDAPSSNGPIIGPLREVRTVVAQAVAAIFKGADVATALAEAETKANQLINDYNALNG